MHIRQLILRALLPLIASLAPAQTIPPHPYASIATDAEGYAGPARNAENDLHGSVLRIGLLAPLHGDRKREGDAMVAAAQIALHDAAPHGLIHGRRLALAVEDASGPSWGMVSNAVIRLILDDDALAVITSTSGPDAHLTEQVGNRIGVPVLTLSADATTTQIDIPWIFRIGPSDVAEANLIAHDIYQVRGLHSVLLVTQQDHDGLRSVDAMSQAASALGAPPPTHLILTGDHPALEDVLHTIKAESPQAIIIWTSPSTAASLLQALRSAPLTTPLYLSQDASANLPETVPYPNPPGNVWTPSATADPTKAHQGFARRFQKATGSSPGVVANNTYDAVLLTARALQHAGPNRARLRDALSRVHDEPGASGPITFDRQGNNPVSLHLVAIP